MDRRTQKTRDAIFQAFNSLLSEKNYSKITIQEIIDRANTGRSTFYAHFETKDELLRALCADLFGHIFSERLSSEKTHDFSLSQASPDTMILHILYHLRDSSQNIKGILSSESSGVFIRCFRGYLDRLITEKLLRRPGRNLKDIPEDFLVNHIAGSFVELVKWWMQNDMKQTPEELERYFSGVVLSAL